MFSLIHERVQKRIKIKEPTIKKSIGKSKKDKKIMKKRKHDEKATEK